MRKITTSGTIVTVRIPEDVLAGVENLASVTTKSKGFIIRRAVETYMLYEGADIFEDVEACKQAAAGAVVDLSDIVAHLDEVVVRIE
ncbi:MULTISPECIES: ribbon-helix-helix protein, CopG family [unclassified Rhizobium]|uniref:ribbon-helix-helix protein, CopG family n=1 Tax=unclassified Rhizobium TaxID=2613769 RepID=UPI001C82DF7B|nr:MULTISPECIES: ribbon-helix-helix protein, CopG family [unclassified Rhizobium]MBX5167012.1 ribbon-helix-helix protein, CopG family [Rhizobium sp. NZLR4b]MBX5211159.1 ribbon-helix-helix protein, CopG family [Rhizobium sp. NZLR11]